MAGSPYWSITQFENFYLEDSWVLDIGTTATGAEFVLEVVLRETHPEFTPPKAGEQYCYRRVRLLFANATSVEYQPSGLPPATDPTGEDDFGNIDSFVIDGDSYALEGDWGIMQIAGPSVSVALSLD